jgi:UrcA family protein
VTVRLGDLDLGQPAGRQTLDRRLRAAVRQVCRSLTVDPVLDIAPEGRCRRATLAEARALAEARIAAAGPRATLALQAGR